jgi:hypothetical protein
MNRQTGRWSQEVTEKSSALDLEAGVFTWEDPKRIANSLKRSAEESTRRKSDPFRSAMSMLTFYINRAGKGLSKERRKRLEDAKDELRKLYGRPSRAAHWGDLWFDESLLPSSRRRGILRVVGEDCGIVPKYLVVRS